MRQICWVIAGAIVAVIQMQPAGAWMRGGETYGGGHYGAAASGGHWAAGANGHYGSGTYGQHRAGHITPPRPGVGRPRPAMAVGRRRAPAEEPTPAATAQRPTERTTRPAPTVALSPRITVTGAPRATDSTHTVPTTPARPTTAALITRRQWSTSTTGRAATTAVDGAALGQSPPARQSAQRSVSRPWPRRTRTLLPQPTHMAPSMRHCPLDAHMHHITGPPIITAA